MKKRLLALILCLVMVIGLVPTVFAAAGDSITVTFDAKLNEKADELTGLYGPVAVKTFEQGAASAAEDAVPVPAGKIGYHFIGWSRTDNSKADLFKFGTDSYPIEDTMTLYAIWEPDSAAETFTVTYRTPDSSYSTSSQVSKGDSFTVQVNESYSYRAEIRSITKSEDDGSAPLMRY